MPVGLLRGIALLPLTPVLGVVWVADRLADEAQRQLTDERAIREQLAALAAAYDGGEISADDYDMQEEQLLRLLPQTTTQLDGEGGP